MYVIQEFYREQPEVQEQSIRLLLFHLQWEPLSLLGLLEEVLRRVHFTRMFDLLVVHLDSLIAHLLLWQLELEFWVYLEFVVSFGVY